MRPALLAAVALTIALAACGGAKSDSSTKPAGGTTKGTTNAPSATVRITDFKFDPKVVSIRVGQTVEWINDDTVFHSVTTGTTTGPMNMADGIFTADLKDKGATASYTFTKAGTFTYFCTRHNVMNAEVRVTA